MRQILRITGLLAVVLMAMWGGPTLAQEASPASETDVATLEGMREAVGRQYAVDAGALQVSPVAGSPTSDAAPTDVYLVTARIVTFDSRDHAAAAYESLREDATGQAEALGVEDAQLTEETIDGMGDGAYAVTMVSTRDAATGYLRILFVLDGETLYILSSIAGSLEGAAITGSIAEAMLEREASDDPPSFHPDGTSTGGLWAIFPDAGDPALAGLMPLSDQQIAPLAE